jgi:hypothetical protein
MVHLMIMASTSFLSNHKRGDNIETGRNQAVHDVTEVILLTAPLATDFKTAFANQRLIASPFLPALTQRTYPTGASPRSVVTGDFDNDGDFDMAVANSDCTANTHLRIPYAIGTSALQRANFSFVTTMGASAELSLDHCWATASKPHSLESPFTFGLAPTYHHTGGL